MLKRGAKNETMRLVDTETVGIAHSLNKTDGNFK